MDGTEARLSWHSLRHSFGSYLATELELPATTVARIMGHADAGFTLRAYARDARSDVDLTADVLARVSQVSSRFERRLLSAHVTPGNMLPPGQAKRPDRG